MCLAMGPCLRDLPANPPVSEVGRGGVLRPSLASLLLPRCSDSVVTDCRVQWLVHLAECSEGSAS